MVQSWTGAPGAGACDSWVFAQGFSHRGRCFGSIERVSNVGAGQRRLGRPDHGSFRWGHVPGPAHGSRPAAPPQPQPASSRPRFGRPGVLAPARGHCGPSEPRHRLTYRPWSVTRRERPRHPCPAGARFHHGLLARTCHEPRAQRDEAASTAPTYRESGIDRTPEPPRQGSQGQPSAQPGSRFRTRHVHPPGHAGAPSRY